MTWLVILFYMVFLFSQYMGTGTTVIHYVYYHHKNNNYREQEDREQALEDFRSGMTLVL